MRVSPAVTAEMAGSAAEKVYDAAERRWCSTTSSDPAQKPPAAERGAAMDPIIMSTSAASTCLCSMSPRPVRPRTPKDQVSSRIRRNLYFNLSSICTPRISAPLSSPILACETHNLGQIDHLSRILEQPLRNDKSPRQRLLGLLLGHFGKH